LKILWEGLIKLEGWLKMENKYRKILETEIKNELELLSGARECLDFDLDVSVEEFDFIIGQGGKINDINESGPDNCYIHRANYLGEYFKTITTEPRGI